jgi:hypothetical protein
MHPYQIDEIAYRYKILLAIVFSAIAAYLLNTIVQYFSLVIPWWIDMPSVLGFFGFFIWLYDNYLWKTRLIQKLKWMRIPNLSGLWETEMKTSQDNFITPILGQITIRQTASKILIALETNSSTSASIIGAIIRAEKLSEYELTYYFRNEPKAESLTSLQIHYGTASFRISDDTSLLEGEYYTGRNRQTFGSVKAKLIKDSD